MQLYIIRHGQSQNNLLWETTRNWIGRSPDPALTDLGEHQANQLAAFFDTGVLPLPTVLFSSLMLRAVQTAAPLAQVLDIPINGRLDLFEVRGPFQGNKADAVPYGGSPASRLSGITSQLILPEEATEDGWYHHPMEMPEQAIGRGENAIQQLMDEYRDTDEIVAVVCHEWFAQYLLRSAIGMKTDRAQEIPWFTFVNTSHALVDFGNPVEGTRFPPQVRWTNRNDHLSPDQLTS